MARGGDDGHRGLVVGGAELVYRRAGQGPAVVVIKNQPRRPAPDLGIAGLLRERHDVIELHPVGFGLSERPPTYDFGGIAEQVLAVLDEEKIGHAVVWGFSQTAAMAALAARATSRLVGLVAGGVALIGTPGDAAMRRMERDPRLPVPALQFWRAYRSVDWHHELLRSTTPTLVYVGDGDHWCSAVRRVRPVLEGCGCRYLELPGLDHRTAGLDAPPSAGAVVVRAVQDWWRQVLPPRW